MSNCYQSASMTHYVRDVKDAKLVRKDLYDILSYDADLTENEDYFEEALELGFDSEADRIIKNFIKENGFPRSLKKYKEAVEKMVYDHIGGQDFFGQCEVDFINLGAGKVSVAIMIGGGE